MKVKRIATSGSSTARLAALLAAGVVLVPAPGAAAGGVDAPAIVDAARVRDADAVRARIADEWAKGVNVYRVPIAELARAAFVLPDERWRVRFARAVGAELDARGAEYRHRRDWSDLLAAS